ncbi:MAG TPA: PilZ domain-containing protein [Candidatus Lustribacter sp.]
MFNIRRPGAGGETAPPSAKSDQKRQSYRASIEFPIVYVVDGRAGTRTASANDLSVGGLRLLGDEDFTKETTIDFRFTLPTAEVANVYIEKEITERTALGERKRRTKTRPTPFEPLDIGGKIVIAFYNLNTKRFAHGVRFLNLSKRTEDEIQRFIHLYQLKQLRERAERGEN